MKERVTLQNIEELKHGIRVTFSNQLSISIPREDVETFDELGFDSWVIGEGFEIRKEGFKTLLNPVNTTIYYKI